MDDSEIVGLYFARDESAIAASRQKYGGYLIRTAENILGDRGESEECLDDALFGAWKSIPPNRPEDLKSYLCKIIRRSAIDILRRKGREKRRATEYAVSLEELGDCVSTSETPEDACDIKVLAEAVNRWLLTLTEEKRFIFIRRYFFFDPVADISKQLNASPAKIKTGLYRLRLGLKKHLEKENLL